VNRIQGHIAQVEVNGSLSLASIAVHEDIKLKTIIVETPETADYLTVGHPITVLFKETEVVIGKGDLSGISLQNRISGIIDSIEQGKLISEIHLNTKVGTITSIISSNAVKQLSLQEGDSVTALIKLNEIMLTS